MRITTKRLPLLVLSLSLLLGNEYIYSHEISSKKSPSHSEQINNIANGKDDANRAVPGKRGKRGKKGEKGDKGDRGPRGFTGATGAAGEMGATGGVITDYAYIYNLTAPSTIPIGADIPFDTNGPITAGISHSPGSTGIIVVNAGTYKISFSVSGVEPNQFAVFIDDSPSTDVITVYGTGTGQNSGQVILVLAAGALLSLRNYASATDITLQTLAGGTQTNVNASLIIERIA